MASNDQLREWLRSIDLSRVAVSAITDDQGNLSSVGSMDEKLLGLLDDLEQEARLGGACIAIVAEQQPIRAGLLEPDARPLRVIKANTLAEAIEALYQEDGPRAAIARHEQQAAADLSLLNRTVSIETRLYQSLPLLREVKRERLPHRPPGVGGPPERAHVEDESQEPTGRLGLAEMLRWEEAIRQEQVNYEPHQPEKLFEEEFRRVVPQARSEVPRFVVLGPPGSGKTTFEQFLAYRFARGQWTWCGRRLLPLRVRLQDWETWAVKVAEPTLPDFLVYQYEKSRDVRPAASAEHFCRWLGLGDVLLLLDGLDEIDGREGFVRHLGANLQAFADCPTVITCRTVSYEQHRQVCPEFPVFTLAGLDDQQRNAYIGAYPPRPPERFDRSALVRQLDQLPAMRPLAANPLLLSIICFVVDDPPGVSLPATRGELYQRAVERLLLHYEWNPRVVVGYPAAPPDVGDKRIILERAALWLFAGSHERLSFGGEQLGKGLRQALAAVDYGEATAPWANALRKDFVSNSGLLRTDRDEQYFFLHPTIEEFLAASALARIVNDPHGRGWDTEIELDGRRRTVRDLVDKKAWDPRWQEVVCLMAGRLTDPTPLLKMLAEPKRTHTNPTGDDYFRYRLALAVLCMAESPVSIRSEATWQEQADRITTDTLSIAWPGRPFSRYSSDLSPIWRVLPVLGQINACVPAEGNPKTWSRALRKNANVLHEKVPLVEWLGRLLREGDPDVGLPAFRDVYRNGALACHNPRILVQLVALRCDGDLFVRLATAVSLLQPPAAVPAILEQLVVMLRDPNSDLQPSAAVDSLGAAAPTRAIVEQLAVMLRDPDSDVRRSAGWAVRYVGATAATPAFLEQLGTLLRDPDSDVRESVAKAIDGLGGAAATPAFLEQLVALLRDSDSGVRRSAAWALGGLGAAATPAIVEQLLLLFRDWYPDVRRSAAAAVGRLGTAAATPVIRKRLLTLLNHASDLVRSAAAEALGSVGLAAALPEFLDQLAAMLRDPDFDVRRSAAVAVGRLGSAAATPAFLEQLAAMLHDPDFNVRCTAAVAVGRLGAAAAMPAILERLLALLHDGSLHARRLAVETVGRLGAAAAMPAILERLGAMLRDPDFDMRWSAAETVGRLGPAGALPEFLDQLAALLRDPDFDVRRSAAVAVGRLGSAAGARIT